MTMQELNEWLALRLMEIEDDLKAIGLKEVRRMTLIARDPDNASMTVCTSNDDLDVAFQIVLDLDKGKKPSEKHLKYMTEPQLREHLNTQLRFIKAHQAPDATGSMLVIFQEDGICQYGSTVDPETAPQALRELADRIERRETVKR